jgi:hypothetical protein
MEPIDDLLRPFSEAPAASRLRDRNGELLEELRRMLEENVYLREEITRLEISRRQALRGR